MNQLVQCRNEQLSLHLNFECLPSAIYATTFRAFRTLPTLVSLVQQFESMIEPNQGESSTSNNDRAEGNATLNSDINDESILPVENNEATASVTQKTF